MCLSRHVVDKFVTATPRWRALLVRMLLPAGLFALSVFGAVPSTAHAKAIDPTTFPATQLSLDPVNALSALSPPAVGEARKRKA